MERHKHQKGKQPRPPDAQRRARIEKHRALVAELLLQGKTYREMANAVGVRSTRTIFEHVTAIVAEWQAEHKQQVNEWVALEIRRVGRVESEAWQAWERSQKDAEINVDETGAQGEKSRRTIKAQVGDPRFLEAIMKCVARRCELLGLDAPKALELPGIESAEQIEIRRRERWKKIMPVLATSLTPAADESVGNA